MEYEIVSFSAGLVNFPIIGSDTINAYKYVILKKKDNEKIQYTFETNQDWGRIACGTFGCVIKYVCKNNDSNLPFYISIKYGVTETDIKADIDVVKLLSTKNLFELYVPSLIIEQKAGVKKPSAVVMEYIDGTLDNIKPEMLAMNNFIALFDILLQIADTFDAFKKVGLWYTDYKPGNIFYRCNNDKKIQVVFGDLGSLTANDYEYPHPYTYKALYVPIYGPRQDSELVWGVAIMMFLLLVNKLELKNSLDATVYEMDSLQEVADGDAYVEINNDNKQAIKNYVVINNHKNKDEINKQISKLVDDIFEAVSIRDTEGNPKQIIKLDDVIVSLKNIISMIKNT